MHEAPDRTSSEALGREAMKIFSHGEPAIVLGVATAETETTGWASRSQQGRCVTRTLAGTLDTVVVKSA